MRVSSPQARVCARTPPSLTASLKPSANFNSVIPLKTGSATPFLSAFLRASAPLRFPKIAPTDFRMLKSCRSDELTGGGRAIRFPLRAAQET